MRLRTKLLLFAVLLALGLSVSVVPAQAQTTTVCSGSGACQTPSQTVSLSMSVPESITLVVTPTGSGVTFTYVPGQDQAASNGPITVAVSGVFGGNRASVTVYPYFNNTTNALANGTSLIPPADVYAYWLNGHIDETHGSDGTAPGSPCNLSYTGAITPGGSCGEAQWNSSGNPIPQEGSLTGQNFSFGTAGDFNEQPTMVLTLVGLNSLPGGILPGTYSGTLTFVAILI